MSDTTRELHGLDTQSGICWRSSPTARTSAEAYQELVCPATGSGMRTSPLAVGEGMVAGLQQAAQPDGRTVGSLSNCRR